MSEENKTVKLKDEELEKVNGGSLPNGKGKILNITEGDVVNISGYINGFDGVYCLVSINEYNAHKFVKYTQGAKYVDDSVRFSTIPNGVTITIIGHDDEFVFYNK